MYTREELEKRIFAPNKEKWIEAALKDYRLKEEAKVQVVENGIILPLKKVTGVSAYSLYAGGVCDENFKFVAGLRRNLDGPTNLQCDEAYTVNGGGVKQADEAVIFGGCLIGHFGHAILECLSRLWHVVENNATERIAFLTIWNFDYARSLYGKFFELLGIDLERIIYIEKPTQFRRVIVPDETVHALGRSSCYKEKYTLIHEKIMSRVEAKGVKKIYLTRSQFDKQDCLNEEYFEEFYRRRGYTVIAPEQHSIEDQIAYMKGAEEVACTMGTLSHLLLFARPGTRLTALLRCSTNPLTQQMIVNQAKALDFYVADVSFNLFPSVHHLSKCFLIGPTKCWREYLGAADEKYEEEEIVWDISRHAYDYLVKFCSVASTPSGWTNALANFDNFDVLNSLSTALLDKPLKREDYKGSFKEKEKALNAEIKKTSADIRKLQLENQSQKAEINRLKNRIKQIKASNSWKITAPLRKIAGLAKRGRKG